MSDAILNLMKANRPQKLTSETDYLGTLPKAELIKDFLINIADSREAEIKMVVLHGSWGSGKTSLMQWIQEELDKEDKFVTVFFEAWVHERDDNIALSLIDVIGADKNGGVKEIAKEVCSALGSILKGVVRSITIDAKVLKLNLDKIIEEADKYLKEDEITFFKKIERFKEAYVKLENEILGKETKKQLVVFIDDLDRCEPENILQLLSFIKLFFTYGKRTIYICGVDKEAIAQAVKTKYSDIIKADEYLEKIFDISFNMSKADLQKIIRYYFSGESEQHVEMIICFLHDIKFKNPRHLKKVLNKYLLIKYYKQKNIGNTQLIPNLDICFNKILVIFIIILYEYDLDSYNEIKKYDEKIANYTISFFNENKVKNNIEQVEHSLIQDVKELSIPEMKSQQKFNETASKHYEDLFICAFITIFTPMISNYNILEFGLYNQYQKQFINDKCKLSLFAEFLYNNRSIIDDDNIDDYILWKIFMMAELYL